MEDEGLWNAPDPNKQKLEKETEEKDNQKLLSLDDLKEIREKIHNYIGCWKVHPYRKRTEEPWDFNYEEELQIVLGKNNYHDNPLADRSTQDILDEFNLFKDVINELDEDRRAFIKYLNETYDPEWRLYLGRLYKLGMDNVLKKMGEDIKKGKSDRSFLLDFLDKKSIPTLKKMDLGDTKDDTYENLVETLDKLWMGQCCSAHFFNEETELAGIGIGVIEFVGWLLEKRGVHVDTRLPTVGGATTAANMHVDCET